MKIHLVPGSLFRVGGAPEGLDALAVAALARGGTAAGAAEPGWIRVVHVCRDDARLEAMAQALRFFAPDVRVLQFPAWDCMPYDRISPSAAIVAERMDTLSQLAADNGGGAAVLLTTVNAATQRVPPRAALRGASFAAKVGESVDTAALAEFLARDGYARVGTAREAGEYALRGGIVDVFPPGVDEPLRLDLFGDVLESIRTFDALTQRTTGEAERTVLKPASELLLDSASVARFRAGYAARFGAMGDDDPMYGSVSAGRRHAGAEHWLPLFHDGLETLLEWVPSAAVTLDFGVDDARESRAAAVAENYRARLQKPAAAEGSVYRPLPPDSLYLTDAEWAAGLGERAAGQFSPYDEGEVRLDCKPGRDFSAERARAGPSDSGGIVLDEVREHVRGQAAAGRTLVVAAFSAGSRDRLGGMLRDHGVERTANVGVLEEARLLPPGTLALAVVGLEHGFETAGLAVLTEQDILGERIARAPRRTRRAEDFVREVSALSAGDLVVHVDHGIGRFAGLETLTVHERPHDCAALIYEGGDRLYLPVENIELLSRYGGDESEAALDRLGGSAWQARKARAKKRIAAMAGVLLRVAAARAMREAPKLAAAPGLYAEFCARFPFAETEDQERTIAEVLADLGSGRPMDRLVCGDVGFGKTEVALRSAFVAALAGKQVALVAPTTLLVRQHAEVFRRRFEGWPVRIGALSRLVTGKDAETVKKGIADGTLDIAIGTHALLAKGIGFADLGLLIVDEEQRFGVAHKERLKTLRAEVHVLTLTATPIPRTLQMALAGIRELSLIATPPVDRLAVRTFLMPFDGVVIREAIQRELGRGGQVFVVCPRIADLDEAAEFVRANVHEANVAMAHGRIAAAALERVMTGFYEGASNVLVATNIIESGLDIPTANTLVVTRADMFGLAELYQLRGRIGRSKARGYAYLTVPASRKPTEGAAKRLRVMQSLDGLGAGFSVASHDMDIRGAGNLLGAEQSGHIREVGFELYQRMLEEAVMAARAAADGAAAEVEDAWSPQINVGAAVLIPEGYVRDLDVRLDLYRRVAHLKDAAEIEALAAEMIDRFGALPEPVEHLLQVVAIKHALRAAGVERLDAGPKGATLTFRGNAFADPAGLVAFIHTQPATARLRPDHKLVLPADWAAEGTRLAGVRKVADRLATIAREAEAAGV